MAAGMGFEVRSENQGSGEKYRQGGTFDKPAQRVWPKCKIRNNRIDDMRQELGRMKMRSNQILSKPVAYNST